ncbi:MAG TPA: sterol desaturase family protein [Blastocatellia bacterium]|nr:sterol desaturase family protein [Blastocatellia bacterium]
MIVFAVFLLLMILTVTLRQTRAAALSRNASEWALDATGLIVQGIAVPALQASLVYGILLAVIPEAQGALELSGLSAFLLNFVAVDYLYYWNHRLLHSRWLWKTHAVHHTPGHVDVFITSRNTLWTPLLIVYVWANGLFVFLLRDPAPFLMAAAITASLDLWRHTGFAPEPGSRLHRALALVLITPNEHTWHHSSDQADRNFGANLSLWDRLHGTYYSPARLPISLGIPLPLDLKRKLLLPF